MADRFEIRLEYGVVGGVEANKGGVEADVGFGNGGAEEEGLVGRVGEMGFQAVEGGEKGVDVCVVGFLGGGEAAFVDAVIDGVVDCGIFVSDICSNFGEWGCEKFTPFIHFVDFFSKMLRVKSSSWLVYFPIFLWEERIEFGI